MDWAMIIVRILAVLVLTIAPVAGATDGPTTHDPGTATVAQAETTDAPAPTLATADTADTGDSEDSEGGSSTTGWVRMIGIVGLLGVWWWRGFGFVRKRQKDRKAAHSERMVTAPDAVEPADGAPGDDPTELPR